MGGGRPGGLSVSGKLEGSSRSKSPGCSSMGSSGDKSSGVYCGRGPVSFNTCWVIEGNKREKGTCMH